MPILDSRVSVSRFGADSFVVAAGGEFDVHTAYLLRDKLSGVLDLGARRVLVDLTGVCFIDSTALGVLVDAGKTLRAARGRMIIVADDPRITRIIEITGLERLFEIEASLPEAVQRLVAGRNGH